MIFDTLDITTVAAAGFRSVATFRQAGDRVISRVSIRKTIGHHQINRVAAVKTLPVC